MCSSSAGRDGCPIVFSSTREVYGDVHRFEGYAEATADFAFTESPYSASKIASEAFIYAYARCYGLDYLAFRFSNVYGRYDNDLAPDDARAAALHPPDRRAASRSWSTAGEGARLHLRRRLRRRDRARDRGSGGGRVANETINLAYGEGNTLVRAAELIGAALGVEPQIETAPPALAR